MYLVYQFITKCIHLSSSKDRSLPACSYIAKRLCFRAPIRREIHFERECFGTMNVGRWLVRLPPCRYSSGLSPGLASKYEGKLKARMERYVRWILFRLKGIHSIESEGVNDLKELREKLGPKPVEPVGKPVWKKSDTLTSSPSQPRAKVPPTPIRKDGPPIKVRIIVVQALNGVFNVSS